MDVLKERYGDVLDLPRKVVNTILKATGCGQVVGFVGGGRATLYFPGTVRERDLYQLSTRIAALYGEYKTAGVTYSTIGGADIGEICVSIPLPQKKPVAKAAKKNVMLDVAVLAQEAEKKAEIPVPAPVAAPRQVEDRPQISVSQSSGGNSVVSGGASKAVPNAAVTEGPEDEFVFEDDIEEVDPEAEDLVDAEEEIEVEAEQEQLMEMHH
jgi:hypothetical protein